MSRPGNLWHIEWRDHPPVGETRGHERRYKSASAAARQVAAILAAPDDVAELVGVWVTAGWAEGRLAWQPVDAEAMLLEAVADAPLDFDGVEAGAVEWYRVIHAAWAEAS